MGKLPFEKYLVEAFKRNKCRQVHQEVYQLALKLVQLCWAENVFIIFTDGLRTFEDQAIIYGKGRNSYIFNGKEYGNPKFKIVTQAKPGTSFHNYGLALDFVTCDGFGQNIDWNVGLKWRRAAEIAKELGFTWGGDWTIFKDYPHIQYDGGLEINQIQMGKMPVFKRVSSIVKDKEFLTVKQYNELKLLIEDQQKEIDILKREKAEVNGKSIATGHQDAWKWAKEKGLFNGENPAGVLTRQQAATVLQRLSILKS
ncbi:M15 family metallopeptidase [Solibacillus silvestris]